MSLEWYPGQRVVCIQDDWNKNRVDYSFTRNPRKGEVLTIRETFPCDGLSSVSLTFAEIRNPTFVYSNGVIGEKRFGNRRFKPLQESRLDQFRKHLVKKPERQDA